MIQDPTPYAQAEIRRLRKARGWSQTTLAEICQRAGLNWDRSILANVESGRRASLTVHEATVIAKIFGVTLMSLLREGPCCGSDRTLSVVRELVGR